MVLALSLVLCAAPVKLTTQNFSVTQGDAVKAEAWSERFVEVLRRNRGLDVTSAGDLQQLLGMERQRQLVGCEANSCLAEIAAALGTEALLTGSITRSGDEFVASLKVLRSSNGKIWWSASERLSSERSLLDWLDRQAVEVGEVLAPGTAGPGSGPLVLGVAGSVVAATGAALLIISNTATLSAVQKAPDEPQLASAVTAGRVESVSAAVCLGVGGAAAVGAVVWAFAKTPKNTTFAVVPTANGGLISVGGVW